MDNITSEQHMTNPPAKFVTVSADLTITSLGASLHLLRWIRKR